MKGKSWRSLDLTLHSHGHQNQIGHSILSTHINQIGQNARPLTNPIYQRHDFQNRRSASEPAHEPHPPNRFTTSPNDQPMHNPNNLIESNCNRNTVQSHQHNNAGDDCSLVDCLQNITTIKVRLFSLKTSTKHTCETKDTHHFPLHTAHTLN